MSKIQVGVIGAGTMGSGIAQVASEAGHEVLLFDANKGALESSRSKLEKVMARLVEKGKRTQDEADGVVERIKHVQQLSEFSEAGIVIEAIIEDFEIKRDLFQSLDDIVSDACILASNTSSLSIASIAGSSRNPGRVIGIHFFNPAPLMKLVEIIPAIQTDANTYESARSLIDSWGKLTVVAKDTPGFIVNRIARPFYSEALRIYEEGFADFGVIDRAMTDIGGFRMGPFTLMDYIGNDVNYAVTESVWSACYYEPRYKPSFTQKRLAEAGYLGRKTGRGYYNYADEAENELPPVDEELENNIFWRILVMLINEAAEALYWGVANRDDIDLAMTKGVNYPKGLLKWADEVGINNVVETMDRLFDEYREERYRCSPSLRQMDRQGWSFY